MSEKDGRPIPGTTPSDPLGFGLGVQQSTTPVTGTIWDYEGGRLGHRVLHIYSPSSGVIIALGANSNSAPANDELPNLAGSVYVILQKAGALHVS